MGVRGIWSVCRRWSGEEQKKQREKQSEEAVSYDTNQTAIYMANKSSKTLFKAT